MVKYTLSEEQIKRFSGLLCLASLLFLIIRYGIGKVEDVGDIIVYFTLGAFLLAYLCTGRVFSGRTAARILVAAIWVNLTLICLLSGGLKMPVLVLYPILPVMALVMRGRRAAVITSGLSIITLLVFIALELYGFGFRPATLPESYTLIMRGFWLIFMIIILTVIGRFYTDKVEQLATTLQNLADTDYLTRLASRKKLRESLAREFNRALRHNKPLSLLLIDIDKFRQLNEKAGTMMGDECLKLIAGAILESCKRTTDISGRFGGDEFMVILPDMSHQDALSRAQQIHQSVESLQIYLDFKKNTLITLTTGCISTDDLKSIDVDKFMAKADELIVEGKTAGGNRVIDTCL